MVTRRTLLQQALYATISATATPLFTRRVFAQISSGFEFYISPTGSDSNPGTLDKPWAITAINSRGREYAGKRVGLLDGTYNVHSLCEAAPPVGAVWAALAVNGGPSANEPTVIAAVNARRAVISAANTSTGAYPSKECGIIGQGYLQVANKGNVILDGLFITRGFGCGICFIPFYPPYPEGGATGIVVRNCELYDIGGLERNNPGGIKVSRCTGALVTNNKIHSVKPIPAGRNSAAIYAFNSHSNIYEYNTIYDCYTGIHDKNTHNGNQTYRYNFIELTGANAVTALLDGSGGDPGDVITVHNNILAAPQTWNGSDMVMPSKQSLVFYNNTCYNTGPENGIFYPAGGSEVSPPAMVKFYNNIVSLPGTVGWAGAVRFCAGTVVLSNYNVYRFDAGPYGIFSLTQVSDPRGNRVLYTLSEWQKTSGFDATSVETGVSATALFAAIKTADSSSYMLRPTAIGRNLGRIGGTPSGAATDVGAWGGGATRIGCDFGPTPMAPL